jgi:hypothetical protein
MSLMDFRKKLTARLVDQGFILACSPKEFGTWVQTTLTRLLSLPAETFVVDGEGLRYQEETTMGRVKVRLCLCLRVPSQQVQMSAQFVLEGSFPITDVHKESARFAVTRTPLDL